MIERHPSPIERLRQRVGVSGAVAAMVVIALVAASIAYRWSFATGMAELWAKAEHRLDLYASNLEQELAKYAYVPSILGLEQDVLALLQRSDDAALAQRVNRFLERLNERIETTVIYVLDTRGKVVAASNWLHPDSFVGRDLSYRPYFQEALQGWPGRFYGIGTTSGEPGYYLSYGIADEEKWLGVAVAKVSLDRLEQTWSAGEAPILVTDEEGIVILSSIPEWKFTSLAPLAPEKRAEFRRNRRYNQRDLLPLGLSWGAPLADGSRFVQLTSTPKGGGWPDSSETDFIAQTRRVPGSQWHVNVFSGTRQVRQLALSHAALAGVAGAFTLLVLLMANERRRHLRERLAAREALQRAHDELEDKVAAQTAELSQTVAKLQAEVAERLRAEKTLRDAQDGLVQAGKLAVIGQLAAGITHELNQPLAALRTLSSNTVKFLDRGNLETVRSNLDTIGQLAERMGVITGQLKSFARKSSGQGQPVVVAKALANALALLDQRIRKEKVEVRWDLPPDDIVAHGDQNRLEQVLVNLIGNALDAMQAQSRRQLDLSCMQQDGAVVIGVRDCGPGLPYHVREHLFEPFFTTKEAGGGLGLGLAISAGIVREFGGTLQGDNDPHGGAVFRVTLPMPKQENSYA